jgi:hypothetical protein
VTNNQVQVTRTLSSVLKVTETETSVEVIRPVTGVVSLTAQGPQGPSTVEAGLLDSAAIRALNSGDIGKVLEWDGTKFTPTSELDNDLTITGGAF